MQTHVVHLWNCGTIALGFVSCLDCELQIGGMLLLNFGGLLHADYLIGSTVQNSLLYAKRKYTLICKWKMFIILQKVGTKDKLRFDKLLDSFYSIVMPYLKIEYNKK